MQERKSQGCQGCREGSFTLPIGMAFQPILDVATKRVFAYEALVRGPNGEGAGWVISQVDDTNRYGFDQACRKRAVEIAAGLGLSQTGALLSINFMPNAVYRPEICIRATMEAMKNFDLKPHDIMFEVIESEQVEDPGFLRDILVAYRDMGFRTAIDDFGAGHSGLNLLADMQPDVVKLDRGLVQGIGDDRVRQAIVRGIGAIAAELDIAVVAEGVETEAEYETLRQFGIELFQGYLFARPGHLSFPNYVIPELGALDAADRHRTVPAAKPSCLHGALCDAEMRAD